ncbi:MAG: glycosyltransferase family 1 protein [Nitrospiraceae bacterium]|nr:glycosyltransferase family 1 protein [Nitrospiraceae bacterium]
MKIGINATSLHEKPTGLGVFTAEVSRCMSAQEKDLLVFSPIPVTGLPERFRYRIPASVKGSLNFSGNLLRAVYLNGVLPLLCRRNGIEVLFCPMIEYPFVPLVPLVVHVHDLHPLKFAPQFKRAAVHFRFSLRRIKSTARRVTVSSEAVKKELLGATDLPEDRIDVVPLAYNRELFYPRKTGGRAEFMSRYSLTRPYLLTVGNLFPYKNLDMLIESFLGIKDAIPHMLVIVGRKEFAPAGMKGGERVFFTDYVPDEDLPGFYSHAEMVVHPSLSEGFGLTPLEAMACGTPVLSSSACALPEVVGNAGILFDPRDPGALGALIVRVLQDQRLRKELTEKGLERAKMFSWEKTASGIIMSCRKAQGEGR